MHQSKDSHYIPMTSVHSGDTRQARPDVHYYTDQIVNLVFIGTPRQAGWVLVDAGMPGKGSGIIAAAQSLFDAHPPAAIVLTHGHFDHVGSIVALLEHWGPVPVYAHPLELPFLTGQRAYPEPDSTVEGGLLAKIAALYPHEPVDIREVVQPLPPDGIVPPLPGWRWVPAPGHSPGQVALFRAADRTLLSADAVITVRQDSMYRVLLQKEEVCGPPVYLTTDWPGAEASVRALDALQPQLMVPGHGNALEGDALRDGLRRLVADFKELAVPAHGRFVDDGA